MTDQTRYVLNETDLPRTWYNINADMPVPPAPVLNPQTMEPVTPDFLNVLFPMELIMQEVSTDQYIDIPEEVRDIYKLYRPTPLLRARRLEKVLDTPAHIYYKYEGVSPAGSHKPNTAIPQAFYNKASGTKAMTTETGAGQWGSALALSCQFFDLDLEVYMVKVSYQQKHHVLLHQTIVGEEALKQMDLAGEYPDVVIGCVGGGSNFSGIAYPFLRQNLLDGQRTRLLAIEPNASPSLTKGVYTFDYGDSAKMAPVVKMYTLGHDFVPAPIHAGGLRYHGMAPSLCALYEAGYIEAKAVPQLSTFEAAVTFSRTEGILPAPESAHAIRGAIDEALDAKEKGEERVILFNLSGHGHFDLGAYEAYLNQELHDYAYPEQEIQEAMQTLPDVPQPM
jgi:tryptophan synthase beta chain